jgi:outer membrane protein assembly factor BamE (lipoprotein component of BamABCDE complex)
MNKSLLLLGLACALALFTGCATATFVTGRDFDSSKVSQITKGKTTAAELTAWVGVPYSKSVNSDGTERWMWLYTQGKSHAQSYVFSMDVKTEMTGKRLSVTLRNGVAEDFSYTDGPMTPEMLKL